MEWAGDMERIPVDIITGMRGAGKTTLINALLEGPYRDRRVSVFTNEVGDVPYRENCRVHPVLGGCICCTAQAELIDEIRRAVREEHPEHLIVEMSGRGTIRDLLQMFSYLPSCGLYQLIYVLDIRKWKALAAVLSDFPQQIRSTPVLLFSRWEEASPELRSASVEQIRQWNPDILLLTDPSQAEPENHYGRCGGLRRGADLPSNPAACSWRWGGERPTGASAFGEEEAPPRFKNKIRYPSAGKRR